MRLIDADVVCDTIADKAGIELYQSEWKSLDDAINSIPTAMQLWTSVKDALPTSDGIYFVVYKFLSLDDCVSTREFRGGKWIEEVGREEVRFWMPIPALLEGDE